MANCQGKMRSNSFVPVSLEAMEALARSYNLQLWVDDEDDEDIRQVSFGWESDESSFPAVYTEETDDYEDRDFIADLQLMIADNQLCIVTHIDWEGLRSMGGCTWLLTNKDMRIIDTSEYVPLMRELGFELHVVDSI